MTFLRHTVSGERCLVVALPAYTPRALGEWQRFISSDPDDIYGLDVETNAIGLLGAFDPHLKMRLIQFGTKTEAWVLTPRGPWRREIESFLANFRRRFVSHNASYDSTRVLTEFGIDLADRSIDTLPMCALRWPGHTMSRDLKDQCDYYIDSGLSDAETALHARFVDDWFANKPRKTPLTPKSFVPGESVCRKPKTKNTEKCTKTSDPISKRGYCIEHYLAQKLDKAAREYGWNNIALTDPAFLSYAGLDAIYVRRLLDIIALELRNRGMSKLSRTEQRVGRIMTNVSRRGHRVDKEWTKPLLDEIGSEYEDYRERVEMTTGYVPGSTYLRDWLRQRGVVFEELTKDTLPDLLLENQHNDEVAPVLSDLIEVSKRKNILTNLRTIWLHATEGDGFTHSNINTQQAHTGRMSITGPAMQTFKKTDKRLRGCFIAREGHVLIGADYNSQEIRIAAALSRDPMYLKIVREGLNQHVLTSIAINKATSGPMFERCAIGGCGECAECAAAKKAFPDEYHDIKILDFMQQYGGGPKKIGLQLDIPYGEARSMWRQWRQTYAGLVVWSESVAKQAFVVNPFGRVIPRDPFREYANGNYLIQSSGRDVLGASICELADHGWADTIWLPVHDELVLEVPEDLADKGCKALTEHMTFQFGDIEIPAEGEIIGTRWGGMAT